MELLLVKSVFKKAYDSVDHVFIDDILSEMGFGERWRFWMECCITTPMLSVLVNGSPTRQFKIEKGLKQGNPLSPFLFNVAVECLSALFKKAKSKGLMKGVIFGMEVIHVSHLQFADDIILFLQIEKISSLEKMIWSKYGVPMNALCWNWNGGPSSSFFTKAMGSLFSKGSRTTKILQEGLRVIVGCGNRASLWLDIKVEGVPLKEAFPRIFVLAINKGGCISEHDLGDWIPPSSDVLMFNVDGSARGSPG
ncbi:hypothetical protein Ddye_009150 [Dipteronia dyeriana]|uniref:Reverse transcriptase domain-containing protein n=1 Tax=Dipteronia dyeriana TaxID=168575 RepID=A0AAE0CML9_9ROSI|nr:hypothetical protein Ddye_009150 [Dipteronia dyeriana]